MPIAGWLEERAHTVEFTGGADPILPTPFRIGETSAAALAAIGLAVSDLWELRTGHRQETVVDTRQSAASLRSGRYIEALALTNDGRYGLSAAIFTQNVDYALRFAREVESGNVHINGAPSWRTDLMPYGGLKMSGTGKEGPRYAVQEMTELKMVVFHP